MSSKIRGYKDRPQRGTPLRELPSSDKELLSEDLPGVALSTEELALAYQRTGWRTDGVTHSLQSNHTDSPPGQYGVLGFDPAPPTEYACPQLSGTVAARQPICGSTMTFQAPWDRPTRLTLMAVDQWTQRRTPAFKGRITKPSIGSCCGPRRYMGAFHAAGS